MNTVVIVQARMGSSRLPGKVTLDLGGKTALERCLSRARRAKRVDEVVVATTTDARDDALVELAANLGVRVFRGSENDVLARYAGAAVRFDAGVIVRVTSDCPLLDPDIVDTVVASRADTGADYASNVLARHLPRGLDVEAVTREALLRAQAEATDASDREHVTRFIVNRAGEFSHRAVVIAVPRSGLESDRWTLDTNEDYAFLQEVFRLLGDRAEHATFREVLAAIDANPIVRELNAHVPQKI